ncbi:MAG: type 1 glutamine amidotransferase [bacterium]
MLDRPALVVQHEDDDPPGRLGEWLTAAGLELDVRAPYAGDALPVDLSGHSALIVLGGAVGAHDDVVAPWLPQVRALLARAVADELPTLAICLGAQLLAVATGGRVEKGPEGPELGAQLLAKRAVAATDPLFGPMPITPDVLQWHYDAILELPPAAVLLASSPVYPYQAFRIGRVVWGLQAHIETTPALVREWAATDPYLYDLDVTRLVERSDAAHEHIEQAWQPVAERFAAVVADPTSVRIGRMVAVTTADPVTDPAAIRAALAQEMQAARGPVPLGLPHPGGLPHPPASVDDDRGERPA